MSQHHVTHILNTLAVGMPREDLLGNTLASWIICEPLVLTIPDSFMPVPDDQYDPCCWDAPWINGLGVHYSGNQCAVVGSDGLSHFYFLFQQE